jgi:hypothetical protein
MLLQSCLALAQTLTKLLKALALPGRRAGARARAGAGGARVQLQLDVRSGGGGRGRQLLALVAAERQVPQVL